MSKELNEEQNASVGMTVGIIEVSSTTTTCTNLIDRFFCSSSKVSHLVFLLFLLTTKKKQVLILQPLNYAKNMVQQQRPISLNPSVMYRGVGANCINMGSCTMIQFAVGGKLKSITAGGTDRDLTLFEEMSCGIAAGTTSALVGSPLELVMIQQQRKGGSAGARIANIFEKPANVGRGFVGAAIREALWTCGYLSIPPVVRRTLMTSYPETFDTNDKARIPAALLGGLFACYLTHPFDTIKTCMQGDIEREVYGSFTQTGKKIMADSGFTGFYRGATFRYGRMVCAVFIMDMMREKIGRLMYPQAYANSQ